MTQTMNHPFEIFAISFVLMSLGAWAGVALKRRRPLDAEAREDLGIIQGASLTLLALMIGFTLSMSVGRYDQRKAYEEEEANAIGTEFLRAELLPGPQAALTRSLLIKYLDQRVLYYRTHDEAQLSPINKATEQLEAELWAAVKAAAIVQPTPITALAVSGMNDVLNTQGYTQAAWWNRIPVAAWMLMILVGVFCNALVGYGSRSVKSRKAFLLLMPVIGSISFMLIADIDSPRGGLIRVAPQNLIGLAQSIPRQ
ncbi:hypothetical protein AWB67_03627 [Caballeronia terrestris]|uniref:DUF4239 domain-containing protein n=1 Tax=Caballeronia terrestris TaxID=1226301 RepID=A0A158JB65_9BURK|nr:hypothetical protein [Caballeronia terrestris]SAL66078.1 hypothetical protein AWB67_03627 [Caballeronia terrestris]